MSLQAWEWEDVERASLEPISSLTSAYQSTSDNEMEEYLKDRTQAQEWDYDDQYTSSLRSSEELASTFDTDEPQVVPVKLVISLALPVNSGKVKHASFMDKYKKPSKPDNRLAKGRRYYHIEYFFLPDDAEPQKVDIVVFTAMAKVFLETEIKTVKLWQEGDKIWVSWDQTFNINMTKELLKKINFHKITMKLWDTKDKVAKKARYYQLKNSNYEDSSLVEEAKTLVLSQKKLFVMHTEKANSIPEELHLDNLPGYQDKAEKYLKSPQVKGKEPEGKKKQTKKGRKSLAEEETDPRLMVGFGKQSIFSIQLGVMPLLAGWQTVITRGSEKSANILDCFMTLKTEVPIMTEEQKQDLNPLTIKIKCASSLPTQPVSIQELERLCTPVYCRYQFHKTPVHETKGQPHRARVYFQDINVIFLGAIKPNDLREYLEGPPMVVEVHDRDRKSEEYAQKPTLFGEDPMDSHINFQALISSKETENNPFESQKKLWDPYGIARVSLAELLLGYKHLNLVVPIHNCEPQPNNCSQDSRNRTAVGFRIPMDVLQHSPIPMGNYLEANSVLKLRVDIAVPLSTRVCLPELDLTGTQFSRIIFVLDSKKQWVLHYLLRDIATINAKALELDNYPTQSIQQIMSAFRVRVKIHDQQNLDVLTGFHLLDGKIHLFILEGLADHGLRQLWESYQRRVSHCENIACKVLYDSQLLFCHRIYANLETILYHVHLFRPLSQLLRDPMLYMRKAVPRLAFQALTRIYDICQSSTNLREVIVRDLLPSSSMVKSLSQEFGIPITQEELMEGCWMVSMSQPTLNVEKFRRRTSTLTMEVLAHQERYLQWRDTMLLEGQIRKESMIQKNIMEASQVNKKPLRSKRNVFRISLPANKAVHNYSIQTLNSSELAKKELYQKMAKEPRKRFTYSQNYLSAMVEPQDSEEEERKAQKKSHQTWLTATGFQVWGLQKSMQRYDHDGRLLCHAELNEEWEENSLFANVLKPVLDRDRWGWDQRHLDFELYKKPPPFLELPPPPARKLATGRRPKAPTLKQQEGHAPARPPSLWGSGSELLEDLVVLKDHQRVSETSTYQAPISRKSLTGPRPSTQTFLSY